MACEKGQPRQRIKHGLLSAYRRTSPQQPLDRRSRSSGILSLDRRNPHRCSAVDHASALTPQQASYAVELRIGLKE
jgi:hypothetical protein